MGRDWLNTETVESCEGVRCRPAPAALRMSAREALTHGRTQHSKWSEPSPPWGTAHLEICTPRRRHPLFSGPTSVWRQPCLSADLRGRQRAARSFWSSGCSPRIYTQCSYGTQQRKGWICLLQGQCLQVHHPISDNLITIKFPRGGSSWVENGLNNLGWETWVYELGPSEAKPTVPQFLLVASAKQDQSPREREPERPRERTPGGIGASTGEAHRSAHSQCSRACFSPKQATQRMCVSPPVR